MTEEIFNALLVIIDAKIAEAGAKDTSDGGLIESIRVNEIVEEFRRQFLGGQ